MEASSGGGQMRSLSECLSYDFEALGVVQAVLLILSMGGLGACVA